MASNQRFLRRAVDGGLSNEEAIRRAVDGGLSNEEAIRRAVDGGLSNEEAIRRTVDGGLSNEEAIRRAVDGGLSNEEAIRRAVDGGLSNEEAIRRAVDDDDDDVRNGAGLDCGSIRSTTSAIHVRKRLRRPLALVLGDGAASAVRANLVASAAKAASSASRDELRDAATLTLVEGPAA